VEFVRAGAADRAGVGGDGAELQAEAGEDARVRVVHVAVLAFEVGSVGMEGIAVLHDEFAPAQDAEAGTALVAELGLDLVEVLRQPAVALQLAARQVGDDLLGGRLQHEVALVAVLEAQELRPVGLPAARLLPQLGGCTTGIDSSIAPARFISWRTTASTLCSTRRPSGSQV